MPDTTQYHQLPAAPAPPAYRGNDLQFDDFIERQPGWLLYSGIPLIFFTFIIIMSLAAFIRYPDRLPAPFTLTTENPPIDLPAPTGGQIEAIYPKNGQALRQGDPILYLHNPASLADVQTLAGLMERLDSIREVQDYLSIALPQDLQVGELRQTWAECAQVLGSFQYLLRQGIVFEKIRALERKTGRQGQLGGALQKQLALFERELSLAEKDFRRSTELNGEGLISDLEQEKNEALFLQKQQRHEDIKAALIRNEVEIAQLRTEQLSLKDERAKAVSEYAIRLHELALRFRNEHAAWRKQYFLEAPMDGTLSLSPGTVPHKAVQPGELLASIVPDNAAGNAILARITPPAGGIGKAEPGNKVLLHLDAYPHKEYGHLEASISAVSLLPVKDQEGKLYYEITCRLPDSLISSIGKPLPFRQRLTGTAQVITKDRSILRRLLDRLLAIKN